MLLLRKLWLVLKSWGSRVTRKHLIHTFVCMHGFAKYCLLFFFRDRGRGRSLKLLQKSCDTRLCSLVIVSILPPILEGRKQLPVAMKVIEQAELFWPFWKISRDSQKFKTTIKAGCRMLTERGERIGSKEDSDISSLFLLLQPALGNWDGSEVPSSTVSLPAARLLREDVLWCSFIQERWQTTENYRRSEVLNREKFPVVLVAPQGSDMQGCALSFAALQGLQGTCIWGNTTRVSSLEALEMHMHWRKDVHTHQSGYQCGIIPVSACGYVTNNAKKCIETYTESQKLLTGGHKNVSWAVQSIWNLCVLSLRWK